MTKNIRMLAVLMLAASLFAPVRMEAAVSQLNPAYVEYMNENKTAEIGARSLASNGAGKSHMSGYVPSPLNWSHLAGRTWSLPAKAESASGTEGARSRAAADETLSPLPPEYDLRKQGLVTPVRDQTYFNN